MRGRRAAPAWMIVMLSACGPGPVGSGAAGSDGDTGSIDESSSSESTASDSTTSDADESETDDPNPSGFVPEDDIICGGGFRCSVACDVFYQDCPEDEKCTHYGSTGGLWDATKCVPVFGDLGPGESCNYDGRVEATDDCDATSMCYDGICRPFCTGTRENPSCPPELGCSGGADESIALCLEICDPLVQDCATGSCYWHNNHFLCNPTGDFSIGEPCGYFVNDCIPGSACVDGSALPSCLGSACCSALCDLEQPDCASLPGTECVAWFEPGSAPAGLELLGVCLSP